MTSPGSSVIISVYRDAVALQCILQALARQTAQNFEIIISEDGRSEAVKQCLQEQNISRPCLHLTQNDEGFRKNRALNRAVLAAQSDHLIFIDGDCIPHPAFVAAHQYGHCRGHARSGRRLELGEGISRRIREGRLSLQWLNRRHRYLLMAWRLWRDGAKNIESGLYSKTLHRFTRNRPIRLLGCNFSCHRDDLLAINGFNEDYRAPGIGEDSDIDWRLTQSGVAIDNVKFSAIQYHLYHPRMYQPSEENRRIFDLTRKTGQRVCKNGIKLHQSENPS